MRIDARIPVVFAPTPPLADDHVVTEGIGVSPEPAHAAGCACCTARGAVGSMLGALFFARARGEVGFFRRIVVRAESTAFRAAVADAIEADPVASACYRLDAAPAPCITGRNEPGAEAEETRMASVPTNDGVV